MARKCKNCGEPSLKVVRHGVVSLRVVCTNCGEVNAQRDYTDEMEYHDDRHNPGRKARKYDIDNQSDERQVSRE